MANKDGVARGRSRFNLNGKDLNRDWDRPADPELAPENAALDRWLEGMIRDGLKPHLALELHNDGNGKLHIHTPAALSTAEQARYSDRMATLEKLLRKDTWFTEGVSKASPAQPAMLAEGWLARYGIDGVVHEFNCNWIAGLNDYANGHHWETYGAELADVFDEYFQTVKP
jgi:glutathione S-transferase